MDTPPAFNLSCALDAWRASLPALPPDDRAELESQLVDTMTELQKAGLTEPEAFLIARGRFGSPADGVDDFRATSTPAPGGARDAAATCSFLFSALGLLVLTAALAIPIWLLVSPKQYASNVMIEIMRTSTLLEFGPFKGWTRLNEPSISNAEFLATQLQIVTAKEPLLLVAKKRGLVDRWRLGGQEEAIDRLRKMVRARLEPGTNLIRITVLSRDKKEARELAEDVAEAYVMRRQKLESESVNLVLGQLTQSRKGQEMQVERTRTKMSELAQQLQIADPAPEGPPFTGPGNPVVDSAGHYRSYNRAKSDYQVQLKILREMIDGQENARLTNLMPRSPAIIHEHAAEPRTYTFPNAGLWLSLATLTAMLGTLSLVVGLLCRPRRGGRRQESALQAKA